MKKYNFILNKLQYGTHETPWDLSIYLYAGASLEHRRTVVRSIQEKKYGDICQHRVQFISNLFDYFEYKIQSGLSRATIISQLERISIFIKWCDKYNKNLSIVSFVDDFIAWVNDEKIRAQKENLNEFAARKMCTMVANIIAKSQGLQNFPDGKSLMLRTQFNKPIIIKEDSDLIKDVEIMKFGQFLKVIIDQLTVDAIRGELPLLLKLDNNKEIILKSHFKGSKLSVDKMSPSDKNKYFNARKALEAHENILDSFHRLALLNLRIEAELYLFISQSNMNLSQALSLKQTEFRMMKQDDEYEVFTVYKNRKQGEATFRCYKDYRSIFLNYLKWLKEIGFTEEDSLFPFVAIRSVFKTKEKQYKPQRLRELCKQTSIPYISTQKLRTFKSNWLFKNSDDKSVVVTLMSHDKKTFEKHYRKQTKLESIKELSEYNAKDLVKLLIGLCASHCQNPKNDQTIETSISPDCINPEGCLFCINHKDIRSYDYCFKLLSHRYLKQLELTLNPHNGNHPAKDIITRIEQKIEHLKELGDSEKKWIVQAEASVMSGDYHSDWSDSILLIEEIM